MSTVHKCTVRKSGERPSDNLVSLVSENTRRSAKYEFFSLLSLYWLRPGTSAAEIDLYTPQQLARLSELATSLWSLTPYVKLVDLLPTRQQAREIHISLLDVGSIGGVSPIESLYKPWSTVSEAKVSFAGKTGYLYGDSAVEVYSLLRRLEISLPEGFGIQPDHLAVLLNVFGILQAGATPQVLDEFRTRHFDWLEDYGKAYATSGEPFYLALTDLLIRVMELENAAAPYSDADGHAAGFLITSPRTAGLVSALTDLGRVPEERKTAVSTCGSCVFLCGLEAETKDGRILSAKGIKGHPTGAGMLCVRGQNYVDIPYAPTGRVTEPLKRVGHRRFEPISWDQAYAEIAERLNKIIDESSPESVALALGCTSFHRYHASRFLTAIGSQNVYEAEGACKASLDAAWGHTLGYLPDYDLANSNYIIYIGRSVADGILPAELQGIAAAHKRGAHIIIVDPRKNSSAVYADEWLAIRPGTDLAFLLALSNVVVSEGLYDHDFIERHTAGFEEYRNGISSYTPEWAERITDIPAKTVVRIAREIAAAAPRAVIEKGFRGGIGISYINNADAVRAIAFFNALLGNYGKAGGNLNPPPEPPIGLGDLDPKVFPMPEPVDKPKIGEEEYPFSLPDLGLTMTLGQTIPEKRIRALLSYSANPALGYGNSVEWEARLAQLDLLVAVEIRMSETAVLADYVLPEVTYLENERGVALAGGQILYLDKVVDTVHPHTRPADRIFSELARAVGVGEYFDFTLDDLSRARLEPFKIDLDVLKRARRISLEDSAGQDQGDKRIGDPVIETPSGKILFADEFWEKSGLGNIVEWVPPLVEPDEESFRLISGNVPTLSHTYGTFSPMLLAISKSRNYDWVWINSNRAKKLGIEDGDEVELISEVRTDRVRAHVTDDIHPQAIFTASNFGARSLWLGEAATIGIGSLEHTPYRIDPATTGALTQENSVKVRKVG